MKIILGFLAIYYLFSGKFGHFLLCLIVGNLLEG